jgi:hypothetical protein
LFNNAKFRLSAFPSSLIHVVFKALGIDFEE